MSSYFFISFLLSSETKGGRDEGQRTRKKDEEETKDEELYQPIRNYYGEVVGWRERSESEKLRRREINAEFAMRQSEEEEEEDQSDKSPSPPPSPPPPVKKPFKVVIKEASDIEEEEEHTQLKQAQACPIDQWPG